MVQVVPLVEGEDVLDLDQQELSWLVSLGGGGGRGASTGRRSHSGQAGRRGADLLNCPLFITGSLLSGLSNSPEILFLANLVSGLCCSLWASATSSYFTEVTIGSKYLNICKANIIII